MKKILSMLLTFILILSMSTVAFAAEPGSITISKVAVKESGSTYVPASTYTAYQMLVLESYDVDAKKYNYKVNTGWEDFFAQTDVQQYLVVNANGYVEWKTTEGEDLEKRAAEIAQLALTYVKNKSLTGNSGFEVVGDPILDASTGLTVATIKVENLPLGYYLVDSTAGALCGLTTTRPGASFTAKNVPPTVEKQVKEDGIVAGSAWGETNDADIDQVIEFDATITIHAGAENYVFHDKMDAGLTFTGVTSITHQSDGASDDLEDEYYEVITNPAGGHCTFEIKFIGDFYKEVKSGDRIIILYTAKLNEDAVYTNEGNKNELWLNYGNDSETTHDSTTTKTYGFDLVKTTTDGDLLPGAKFKIYTAATGGDAIQFVKLSTTTDGKNYDIYRLATADEIANASVTKYTEMEVTKGAIRIFGLDKSHYYLEETVAPENYNKLKERKEISLEFSNFLAFDTNDKPLTNTGFQVINQSGSILPETGAAGTTAFITMGMILVLGAGMLLITKKRMAMIQD